MMSRKVRAILAVAIAITAVSARAESVGEWNRDHSRVLQAVQSLTGSIYGDYTHGSMSLAEAFGETLGIPDGGYAPLGDRALYSGCRQHSCGEKAAVLFDQHARVRAAGLIHFNCTNARRRNEVSACLKTPILVVLTTDHTTTGDSEAILAWAREKAPTIARIETIKSTPSGL